MNHSRDETHPRNVNHMKPICLNMRKITKIYENKITASARARCQLFWTLEKGNADERCTVCTRMDSRCISDICKRQDEKNRLNKLADIFYRVLNHRQFENHDGTVNAS